MSAQSDPPKKRQIFVLYCDQFQETRMLLERWLTESLPVYDIRLEGRPEHILPIAVAESSSKCGKGVSLAEWVNDRGQLHILVDDHDLKVVNAQLSVITIQNRQLFGMHWPWGEMGPVDIGSDGSRI